MTLILTVPDRLVMMAMDASPAMADGSSYFMAAVDEVQRPFVLVEVGQDQMDASAAGVELPVEEYTITLIAEKYGQGAYHEAELQLRTLTAAVKTYIAARTQLQFSNTRELQASALGALAGVMWARLYLRSYAGVVQKGGDNGEQPFWGTVFSLRVQEVMRAEEILV